VLASTLSPTGQALHATPLTRCGSRHGAAIANHFALYPTKPRRRLLKKLVFVQSPFSYKPRLHKELDFIQRLGAGCTGRESNPQRLGAGGGDGRGVGGARRAAAARARARARGRRRSGSGARTSRSRSGAPGGRCRAGPRPAPRAPRSPRPAPSPGPPAAAGPRRLCATARRGRLRVFDTPDVCIHQSLGEPDTIQQSEHGR